MADKSQEQREDTRKPKIQKPHDSVWTPIHPLNKIWEAKHHVDVYHKELWNIIPLSVIFSRPNRDRFLLFDIEHTKRMTHDIFL